MQVHPLEFPRKNRNSDYAHRGIVITKDLDDYLRHLAEEHHSSINAVVRTILEAYRANHPLTQKGDAQ